MTLKPLNCPNCGGKVNREKMVCEYCGTPFKIEGNTEFGTLRIEHFTSPTRVIATQLRVSREQLMIAPESVEGYAKREIAEQMAQKLLEGNMIEMISEMDWKSCEQVISARLRVLDPHFRF